MLATEVKIHNYKSIRRPQTLRLDQITTLVGANESGKTNVLKAIDCFRSEYEYGNEDLCSTPRGDISEDSPMLSVRFKLTEEERNKLKAEFPALSDTEELSITKTYAGDYVFETRVGEHIPRIDITQLFEEIAAELDALLHQANKLATERPELAGPASGLVAEVETLKNEMRAAVEGTLSDPQSTLSHRMEAIVQQASSMPVEPPWFREGVATFEQRSLPSFEEFIEYVTQQSPESFIRDMIPPIIYFSEWDLIEDSVPIADLRTNPDQHRTMMNLLKIGGLSVDDLKDLNREARNRATNRGSRRLTRRLRKAWNQERNSLQILVSNGNVDVYLTDSAGDYGVPSRRSPGFVWYLSFYINFIAESMGELRNSLILLDEPGIHLHARGQADLLMVFEEIAKENQIIYTTHYPYLINKEYPERIRAVLKEEDKGSVIDSTPYRPTKEGPWEPIRSAIGLYFGDSLFIGGRNLIVEGISDHIILAAMSKLLGKKDKNHLDLHEISIVPAGGASNIPHLAYLAQHEHIKCLVLLDSDRHGERIASKLQADEIIPSENILRVNDFCREKVARTTEDLFDPDFYCRVTSLTYKKIKGPNFEITLRDIEDPDEPRIAVRIAKYFSREGLGDFSKRGVAVKLREMLEGGETPSRTTRERFEKLFGLVNEKLLPANNEPD